jgi:hypothetical protein
MTVAFSHGLRWNVHRKFLDRQNQRFHAPCAGLGWQPAVQHQRAALTREDLTVW